MLIPAVVAALVATARGLGRLAVHLGRSLVEAFLDLTNPARRETGRPARELTARSGNMRRRLAVLLVVLAVLFTLVGGRLAALQVFGPEDYAAYGLSQRMRVQELPADRGAITDRSGVPLAVSVPQQSIFVDPALIDDPRTSAALLAEVLGAEPEPIEARMRADNRFGYVARHVPDDLAARVADLELPGVAFVEEPKRFAPSGSLGSSIVGLVDTEGVGLSGIEEQFAELLEGTPGRLVFEQSPSGHTIPVGEHEVIPARKGHDVRLTVDRSLQFEVERILGDTLQTHDAAGGIAVVTRPDTGEILAMANMEHDREAGTVGPSTNNGALTTVFEPGSVMKIVGASGAIEDGHVTPDTPVVVPDAIQFGPDTISEHRPHGTVSWTVHEIIQRSSNTGSILLAQMLGKERLHEYLKAFGFGDPTGLGFPNEAAGYLMHPDDWWISSIGTIPIGQGISVTPLQMLLAYNVIANGGTYLPPTLVGATVDPDGSVRPAELAEGRRVVTRQTADEMNLMLRSVVGADGTARQAAVPGYTVAGKTGTARKPQPNGTYADEYGVTHYQATFVGFAPAEAPAVSVLVMVDDPRAGTIFGGEVAAPAFAAITQHALQILEIQPPETDLPAGGVPAQPDLQAQAVSAGGATGPAVQTTADGRIRAPAAGTDPDDEYLAASGGASPVPGNPTGPSGGGGDPPLW